MSIQFNPHLPVPAGATEARGQPAASLAGLLMAPVALTPLEPPAPGRSQPAPAAREAGGAAEVRQSRFAERQKALLDRLQREDADPAPVPGRPLSAAQRGACVSVLATIAAAIAAK